MCMNACFLLVVLTLSVSWILGPEDHHLEYQRSGSRVRAGTGKVLGRGRGRGRGWRAAGRTAGVEGASPGAPRGGGRRGGWPVRGSWGVEVGGGPAEQRGCRQGQRWAWESGGGRKREWRRRVQE